MDTPEYKRLVRFYVLKKISKQSFDSHLRLILSPEEIETHNHKMIGILVNSVNKYRCKPGMKSDITNLPVEVKPKVESQPPKMRSEAELSSKPGSSTSTSKPEILKTTKKETTSKPESKASSPQNPTEEKRPKKSSNKETKSQTQPSSVSVASSSSLSSNKTLSKKSDKKHTTVNKLLKNENEPPDKKGKFVTPNSNSIPKNKIERSGKKSSKSSKKR